ncbi:MAG: phosphomannomutase/phosphoglucomutase [Acidimicrobiia bacterium]|nr:phosphomannomutase/phosphoglucomutase [Acidimicrobiia bacterium]NNF64239.1 phosphomannomutase/phosphoglucomutase [Acidimicrobiia bacterium]
MDLEGIFKAYDVRGKVPSELDEEAATRIGVGFAEFADVPAIAVGWDCRSSSPALRDALVDGVTRTGTNVDLLGGVTTDVIYYVSGEKSMPGVMITASHNPKGYNGMKFCLAAAVPVAGDSGLASIKATAIQTDLAAEPVRRGEVRTIDPLPGYIEHLLSVVDSDAMAELRVAADGGNGMAGVVVEDLFDRIPPQLIGLYLEPDGEFPNHHPDPLRPENLVDLSALVDSSGADLGVAFDGDADRAFFIDDKLIPLPGSTTTAMVAAWFLAREPGASIVYNLICSKAVPEAVTRLGGNPIRTRVGHSYIKQIMADSGAVFGGEHSGHYYFRENYRADSGLLTMLVLLQLLSEDGRKLSEMRKDFEPYSPSGEINLTVEDKEAAMAAVAESFADASIDLLDGLTVEWSDRWFNLRSSNTESVLRLNAEAGSAEDVDALVASVRSVIDGSGD